MSTSTPSKPAYHHGELRPALLEAASFLLEDQGIKGISLREVARRAGVSHNAPYRHFADREALLAALAQEGFAALGTALQDGKGRDMGLAYVKFALAYPQRFRLMFGGVIGFEAYPELRTQARAAYAALERSFESLGNDAKYAAAAAWSLVHGLASLLLDGHFAAPAKEEGSETFAQRVLAAARFAAPR